MTTNSSHIIIDSRTRITGDTSEFSISLQEPLRDFVGYSLINVMIPNVYYNVIVEKNNVGLNINGTYSTIVIGNYSLANYMTALQTLFPGLSITFNVISSRITISSAVAFIADFTNINVSGTASALGFQRILYPSLTSITASYPPNISPLGILINIDNVPNTTSLSLPTLRSSSFMVNNNTDSLFYTQFFENSNYTHTVRTTQPMNNTLHIKLLDLDGFKLINAGEWIMIIRTIYKC